MAQPVSEGGIDDESIQNECATNNSIEIEPEAKLKLLPPNACDEKENALQDKERGKDQSGTVDGAEKPEVIDQPHPDPEQGQNQANALTKVFSS